MVIILLIALGIACLKTGFEWWYYPDFVEVMMMRPWERKVLFVLDLIDDKNTILFGTFALWFIGPLVAMSVVWWAINNPGH